MRFLGIVLVAVLLFTACGELEITEYDTMIDGGDMLLPAVITRPVEKTNLPVVILVSAEQDRDLLIESPAGSANAFAWMAEQLAKQGVAVLRYDSRPYLLRSEEKSIAGLMPDYCTKDALAAIALVETLEYANADSIVIAAHGTAGSLLLDDANQLPVHGLVLFSPPVLPMDQQILHRLNHQAEYFAQSRLAGSDAMADQILTMRHEFRNFFDTLHAGFDDNRTVMGYSAAFWRSLIRKTQNFTGKMQNAPFRILIVQGTRDLFNPAELLKPLEEEIKSVPNAAIEYITGMTHELYDYMMQTFQPDTVKALKKVLP